MRRISHARKVLFLLLLLIVISLLTYGNTLTNSFVYDDELVVKNNFFIRSWNNLPLLFRPAYFRAFGEMSYRPMVTLSYFFDYSLWKLNPAGYHLTNLFIHALNGVLLFLLVLRMTGRAPISFVSAVIFIIHPVTTEAVNGISFREDLLAAAFFLAAFLAYMKISGPPLRRKLSGILCLVFFSLALFSKEMAATLPLVLLLYELSFGSGPYRSLKEKSLLYSGLFSALGLYLLVRFVLLRCPEEIVPNPPLLPVRILIMSKTIFFYFRLLIFPWRLSAEYLNPVLSFPDPPALLATGGLLLFLLFSALNLRRFPAHLYGVWWFFLTLLPAANIIPLYNVVAERYLYLPVIGFALTAAFTGETFLIRSPGRLRRLTAFFLCLWLCFYAGRTIVRNRDWKNLLVFCQKTLDACPESVRFRYNLGVIYDRAGLVDEAIEQFKKTLEKDPDYIKAHNNLGLAYRKKGMPAEAVEEFRTALRINPRYFRSYNNLGLALQDMGRFEEAVEAYKAALKIKPEHVSAHNNLGLLYQKQGLLNEAAAEYRTALEINPRYAKAFNNLGLVFARKGDFVQAKKYFQKALTLDPDLKEAKDNLGKLGKLGY